MREPLNGIQIYLLWQLCRLSSTLSLDYICVHFMDDIFAIESPFAINPFIVVTCFNEECNWKSFFLFFSYIVEEWIEMSFWITCSVETSYTNFRFSLALIVQLLWIYKCYAVVSDQLLSTIIFVHNKTKLQRYYTRLDAVTNMKNCSIFKFVWSAATLKLYLKAAF